MIVPHQKLIHAVRIFQIKRQIITQGKKTVEQMKKNWVKKTLFSKITLFCCFAQHWFDSRAYRACADKLHLYCHDHLCMVVFCCLLNCIVQLGIRRKTSKSVFPQHTSATRSDATTIISKVCCCCIATFTKCCKLAKVRCVLYFYIFIWKTIECYYSVIIVDVSLTLLKWRVEFIYISRVE